MSSKQIKTKVPTDADLKANPMIGQSAGVSPEDLEEIEADNTVEGDTLNGTNANGGIDKNEGATTRHK